MVAQNIQLPNIRKFFIPDPGYAIVDADLSGADAQVVTWEAEDEDLKAAFRAGLKIHIKNARDLFPDETRDLSDADLKKLDHPGGMYHDVKRSVHGTNYGAQPPTLARKLKWPIARAQMFQERWFYLHPGILEWQERTKRMLLGTQCWNCRWMVEDFNSGRCKECDAALGRTIKNAFNYRITYFERPDSINLPDALAWTPQSTVAINCSRGMILLEDTYPEIVEMLLQVHDSLVFQIFSRHISMLPQLRETLNQVTVPYPDPLRIPWGMAHSLKSWGHVE